LWSPGIADSLALEVRFDEPQRLREVARNLVEHVGRVEAGLLGRLVGLSLDLLWRLELRLSLWLLGALSLADRLALGRALLTHCRHRPTPDYSGRL
jgi:hypothetical protein